MWLLMLAGCRTTVSDRSIASIDDAGVDWIEARVQRGDLAVVGNGEASLVVTTRRVAEGRRRAAERRNEADAASVEVVFDTLRIDAPASHQRRRTDVDVLGPEDLGVIAWVTEGVARIDGVTGDHDIEAPRIEIVGGQGDRVLVATTHGARIEGEPASGDVWQLDVTGDLAIALPRDAEVRLDAVLSEGARAEVTLPFEEIASGDDFVRARTGSGAVDIQVDLRLGTLFVSERAPDAP